jgi:hypothetical protein
MKFPSPLAVRRRTAPTTRQSRALPRVEELESRQLLDATSFVQGLYTALLHRSGTQQEVGSWVSIIQSGARTDDVVHAFANGLEHQANTIRDDYQQFLGRGADGAGLAFWQAQMRAGATEDQIASALLGSAEYRSHHGGTDDGVLSGFYQEVLGRGADDAGRQFWTSMLQQGVSAFHVAAAFTGSHEHHARDVAEAFQAVLGRVPDDSGSHFWEDRMDHGLTHHQLEELLAESNEFGDDHGGNF